MEDQLHLQQPTPTTSTTTNSTMLVDIKEYNGEDKTYPLSNWLQNIKVANRMNKWSIEETRDYVLMRAVGKAGRRLQNLPHASTIEELLQAITVALKSETTQSTAFQDAMRNGQKKNETVQALGDRVRNMIINWGGSPFNEKLAIEFFHGMLACRQTRFNIACNKRQIATLAEAITHAEDYQANLRTMFGNEAPPQHNMAGASANFTAPAIKNAMNMSTEDMDISAMNRFQGQRSQQQGQQTCFYCDKLGHIGTHCNLLAKHKRLIAAYEDRIRNTAARGRGGFRAGRGGTSRGRGAGQSRPYPRQFSRPQPRLQEMEELLEKMREMDEQGMLDDTDFVVDEEQQDEQAEGLEEEANDENQAQGFH